jgi:hypothetical protein
MADHDDPRIRVVADAADTVRLCLVWKVELLHSFANANVPQLQGVILLQANQDIPQSRNFGVRSEFIDE